MIKVLIQNPIDFKFPNVNLCVPTNFWQYFTLGSLQGLGEWNNCKLSASFFIESLLHMDWFILLNFQNNYQGCALRKIQGSPELWNGGIQGAKLMLFSRKSKKKESLVAQEQNQVLGTTEHCQSTAPITSTQQEILSCILKCTCSQNHV